MHHTARQRFRPLVERLNRFPQGAAASPMLYNILSRLFLEKDAELVARLPLRPFTAAQVTADLDLSPGECERFLQGLADRGLLLDVIQNGESVYTLPPPMAGFFEFSLMRARPDLDQAALSEMFYQYINVEEDFIKDLIKGGPTQAARVFVREENLTERQGFEILDFERATAVIREATDLAVGLCYCRHKMSHLGKACTAEQNICMTLNDAAQSLIRHGIAQPLDVAEAIDLLAVAKEQGLVQIGENAQRGIHFLCHCCGCCCEGLLAAKRFACYAPIHPTSYLVRLKNPEICTGCGLCQSRCPIGALFLEGDIGPVRIGKNLCLGCGICVSACPKRALILERRKRAPITPLDTAHRFVLQAIERGRLQYLIFDHQALLHHRIMAIILGAILRLPPVKRKLAQVQLSSRYLDSLVAWKDFPTNQEKVRPA